MKRSLVLKIVFSVFVIVVNVFLLNFNLRNKFHDVVLELGTEGIDVSNFVVSKAYAKSAKFVTDIKKVDIGTVSEYDVVLSFGDKEQTVKLKVVDTTAPKVDFVDLEKGVDYKIKADDFVALVKDNSAYTITSEEIEITSVGDYKVLVTVEDDFGNKTSEYCNLRIALYNNLINHELGESLVKEEFLIVPGYGDEGITRDVLASVDVFIEGEYPVTLKYDGEEYLTKVVVKDTKGPEIVVNNINFYLGNEPKKNEDFIKSIKDPSGVKEITYDGELDYTKIGTYELKIKAVDNLGNVTESVATLNVRDDNIGPVFSGVKDITITKNQEIDFYAGVSAVDAKDGPCEFSVDTSGVNVTQAGTYYAIYTSSDTSNNVTTKKRKVVVSYDMSDMDQMAREFYDKYLAGKSVLEMTKYIKSKLGYSHTSGSDADALYQILTKKSGSCRGHAFLLQKALDFAGYQNKVIKTLDGTHYWNLVYENGVWRHYDSTPGGHIVGPATDKEKLSSWGMAGRKWDTSAYPAAN